MEPPSKAKEEIKARLEVAQLYEEMGQNAKAARYYLAAAETALKAKFYDQGREFLDKVLELEPDNAQAQTYLQKLEKHLSSLGVKAAPKAAAPVSSGTGLSVPTPSVYLTNDQIAAILAQVSSAPNPKFFPFDPLPKVETSAIAEKAKIAEAAKEAERIKNRTAVGSAFSSDGPSFQVSGGFLNDAQRSNRGKRKKKKAENEAQEGKKKRKGRRGANTDLADSIRKKLLGG